VFTDLHKILHTPIVVRNTLVGCLDLDRDRRVGGSRPNQNDYVFVILVTHPKFYIETTDRRNFGGKPHSLQETVLPQTNGTDGKPRL